MSFSLSTSYVNYRQQQAVNKSFLSRFLQWTIAQDKENHVLWVGLSISSMAAVFFPLSMFAILVNGASFGLIIAAMSALALVVITNLAALPTKYTIPFFLIGVIGSIVISIVSFFV